MADLEYTDVGEGRVFSMPRIGSDLDPHRAFDFIALPKNHVGVEVTQTSAGEHCTVLPLRMDIDSKVRLLITGAKLSRTARVADIDKAIARLTALRDELSAKSG